MRPVNRPLFLEMMFISRKRLKIVIDENVLKKYEEYYFEQHPRAHKRPILHPYHESINAWMIMPRPMMNGLKQKWKEFIKWYVGYLGYTNLRIMECDISQKVYYATNRPHDTDNSTPKFILDGFVESGLLISDDSRCVQKLTLQVFSDPKHPRTEFLISIRAIDEPKEEEKENDGNGKEE